MNCIKQLLSFFLAVILAIPVMSQSGSSLSLSLSQAREYAIEHNKILKNSAYDVAISEKQVWANIAQGLPQIEGSVDYTDFFNYEVELNFGGGDSVPNIDFTKLDAGDHEILSLLNQMMGSSSSTIKMDNSSSAKLQLSQLIFSGQYLVGLKIARIAHSLSKMAYDITEKDITEAITMAYYVALVTEESTKIMDISIENLNKTMEQTRVMLVAGLAEPVDLDQIELAVMMLTNAKSQMNRAVEMSYNLIRFQLGVDANTEIILTEKLESIINNINFGALLVDSFVLDNNPSYKILVTQEELSNKMMQLEKWNYAPVIVGFYSYNEKLLTTDFDMNPRHIAGVSMKIPIFSSGMRNAKVQQKKIEFEKARNTRLMVEDQLLMQEKQYRYDLLNAYEQYELQKRSIEVAQRVYDKTELKYTHGVASSLELTQASDNLLKAQNNYVSAIMNLLQAKLNFDKLLNNL